MKQNLTAPEKTYEKLFYDSNKNTNYVT